MPINPFNAVLKQPATENMMPKLGRHVTSQVVSYDDDRALLVIKLAGIPFESMDDAYIENRFNALNRLLAALGKEKGNRLSLWTTLKRERVPFKSKFSFTPLFMQQFSAKYLKRFSQDDYFENIFYISLILKHDDLQEGAEELEDIGRMVLKTCGVYDPTCLETYEHNGIVFSEVYEFLGSLINGSTEKIPVVSAAAREIIASSWLHFGYDMAEVRSEELTKFAVSYDLKDFPDRTTWGLFDKALSLPMEFTLTQSFVCMGNFASQKAISSQINKLRSVGDRAFHQIDELEQAIGYIGSGELAFGEYHAALVVYGKSAKEAAKNGTVAASCFLGECGARFVKATLSSPITYFSQIPGTKIKPRPMLKASRNLAAAFSMHNYSSGKSTGNPIGDGSAVIPLQTTSSTSHSFNFHYSKKTANNFGEKVAGHTMLLGATGTGKTVLQTALIGFLERFGTKIFALDKDEGMKIFIYALGGKYFSLKAGVPTGLAPFQLPNTPKNRQFLYSLVATCGKDHHGNISSEESTQIKNAVDATLDLPLEHRCFSRLLENIPRLGGNDLAERLAKWCASENGEYAWALDNTSNIQITDARMVGFDVTDFLVDNFTPTEPVLTYLFHLKSLMQQHGGLLATIVEEFWLPAKYPTTQAMMFDVLKTGRKRDEFMLLVSQSPEDAINSPIFAAIRDQTPTKILLPNPSAEFESYQRCGLTQKEFAELQKLDLESRTFLIKQGNQSAFATMDLYGMDDEISILSGNAENIRIFDEVIQEVGTDPAVWMPVFQERRKGKRSPQPQS